MNDKVRQHLAKQLEADGDAVTDDYMKELLIDGKTVWEGERDEHRWIIYFDKVVEIDGMFIQFGWATCTGDNSLEDSGFEWDWNTVCEVVPKEVMTTTYVPVS